MSSPVTPPLQSFNPHAVHYFTSAASSPRPLHAPTSGVPLSAYPTHVLVASTSPSSRAHAHAHGQPPKNNSVPSQSTPAQIHIQSPQPTIQAKGFAIGGGAVGAASAAKRTGGGGGAIFEPFSHKRSVTPELDDVLKKKGASWGQWELEQGFQSK